MFDNVGAEKQYEYVTSQVAARNNSALAAYKHFVQLFSAIVGGSVWLTTGHAISTQSRWSYVLLSDAAVALLIFVTFVLAWENMRSWREYRETQCELVGRLPNGDYIVPYPSDSHVRKATKAERMLTWATMVAGLLFFVLNPFWPFWP